MTEQQRCQKAATAPACLEMPVALLFTAEHVDEIRAAGATYRRLFELRAIGPEWAPAYAEWQRLAEAVAVVVLHKLEALEGSHQ
ncbi:hypothetical protein D3C78_908410 [compost metagenome]